MLVRQSVLGVHSGRLFSSFTGRQGSAPATSDALSYESMLALDENNPKRGVKQHVLDKLQSVCVPTDDVVGHLFQ